MKSKKISFAVGLAAIFGALVNSTASAQSNSLFQFDTHSNPSVETFCMEKYGAVSSNLSTCAMSYSLPIYSYSDPDFTVPISLEYSFGGYQPAMHSGQAGLGWHLNCGGCINREVRGIPDESDGSGTNNQFGFWYTCHDSGECNRRQLADAFSTYPLGDFYDLTPYSFNIFSQTPMYPDGTLLNQHSSVLHRYDISPDIFHFSCQGGHGDFCLTDSGDIVVFNTDSPYGEIDVSMTVDEYDRFCVDIEFGDGYVYRFGHEPSCYEYSATFPSEPGDGFDPESWSRTLTSLKLYKIIAPNGRNVTFHYSSRWQVQASASVCYTGTFEYEGLAGWDGSDHTEGGSYSKKLPTLSCAYTCPLESIEVDDDSLVSFIYADKECDEFRAGSFIDSRLGYLVGDGNIMDQCGLHAQPKALSSVVARNRNGRLIEKAYFTHIFTRHDSGTAKMFPTGASFHTKGNYYFEYNVDSDSVFPKMDTQGIDHWGYWNGHLEYDMRNVTMNSVLSCQSLYDQLPEFDGKDPDWNYSVRGALTGIVYPTGGRTVVEYEPHRVGKRLDQCYGGCPGLSSLTEDYTVGGVRVKTIENHTGSTTDSLAETKSYTYLLPSGNGISSGELMHMPRYGLWLHYHIMNEQYNYEVDASLYTKECMPGLSRSPHVSYTDVQEHAADGSWTDYRFLGYEDLPDIYYDCSRYDVDTFSPRYLQHSSWCDDPTLDEFNHVNVPKMILRPASVDNSVFRGKLVQTTVHASDGSILSREINSYHIEPVDTVRTGQNELFALTSFPFICQTAQLVSTETRTYREGGMPALYADQPHL